VFVESVFNSGFEDSV